MKLLALLFSFSGRAPRKQFWFTYSGYAVLFIAASNIAEFVADPRYEDSIIIAAWIPGALAVLSVMTRRLHDRDRGAIWFIVFFVLPTIALGPFFFLVSQLQAGRLSRLSFDIAMSILVMAANIPLWWGLIEIGFLRGTRGPNRFGPDPRSPTQTPESFFT